MVVESDASASFFPSSIFGVVIEQSSSEGGGWAG